jgi:hypothetical protein
LGYIKVHVYRINPHTVQQELQVEIEGVAEEITGDLLSMLLMMQILPLVVSLPKWP